MVKYFISTEGALYAFESDGSQDGLITADMRPATESEAAAIQTPPPLEGNAEILAQINAIEQATMVPRLVREGLIVMAEDLAEREAAKLTADGTPTTKEELLAANIGYQKTKAVDDQIRYLRSQLK